MVVGAQTEKADKEEQMKLAWLANNSYGPVSFLEKIKKERLHYIFYVFLFRMIQLRICQSLNIMTLKTGSFATTIPI